MAISWLSADVNRSMKGVGKIQSFPVKASTRIYKGQLVALDSGFLMRASDSLGISFAGVAYEGCNNSSGNSGDKWCRVYRAGVFLFTADAAIADARLSERAYAIDDNQIQIYSAGSHLCLVGVLVEKVTTTSYWVDIEGGLWAGVENGVWFDPFADPY